MNKVYRHIFTLILIFMFPLAAVGQESLNFSNRMNYENRVENIEGQSNLTSLYPSPKRNSKYLGIGVGTVPFSSKIKEESMIGDGGGLSFDFGYAFRE